MPLGGLFKVVLWLAPVLMLVFYMIAQKQESFEKKVEVESQKFDQDFAHSMASFDNDSYWKNHEKSIQAKLDDAEEEAKRAKKKKEELFKKLENEMADFEVENNGKNGMVGQ